MLVKLKRALLVAGRFYQPGVQDIPEVALKHPHFVRYIKLSIVVPPEHQEIEKLETPMDRAKRLFEKEKVLEAKRQELLKKVDPPPKKVEDAPVDDSKDEAPASDDGKKKSKKG